VAPRQKIYFIQVPQLGKRVNPQIAISGILEPTRKVSRFVIIIIVEDALQGARVSTREGKVVADVVVAVFGTK